MDLATLHVPMTAEEFEKLPEVEGLRFELWGGNLVVMSAAQVFWHSRVAARIERLFADAGYEVVREVAVDVGGGYVPSPDVTVFRDNADINRTTFPASAVRSVVEVISPESGDRDRHDKPRQYAHGRISEYWLADRHPASKDDAAISIFQLTPAGKYGLVEEVALSELERRGLPSTGR